MYNSFSSYSSRFYNNPYRYTVVNNKIPNNKKTVNNNNKVECNQSNNKNIQDENVNSKRTSEPKDKLFDIFGISVCFDDILILCILLFLYQENIQDDFLFISLILLLLD